MLGGVEGGSVDGGGGEVVGNEGCHCFGLRKLYDCYGGDRQVKEILLGRKISAADQTMLKNTRD